MPQEQGMHMHMHGMHGMHPEQLQLAALGQLPAEDEAAVERCVT